MRSGPSDDIVVHASASEPEASDEFRRSVRRKRRRRDCPAHTAPRIAAPGDPFAGLPAGHPLLTVDPHAPLSPNLAEIAAYVEPEDTILDVGGGGGRYCLPLALRCRAVINVDESLAMGQAFEANAESAGIAHARFVHGAWASVEAPTADLLLVSHVLYLTRDIVPFIRRLQASAPRRIVLMVNNPPPPSWFRAFYEAVFGEPEEIVPGHVELVNVLWEMDILPDVWVLPQPTGPVPVAPTREAAIALALGRLPSDQWATWPLGPALETRARQVFESRFDELFLHDTRGFVPRHYTAGREILITWTT